MAPKELVVVRLVFLLVVGGGGVESDRGEVRGCILFLHFGATLGDMAKASMLACCFLSMTLQ